MRRAATLLLATTLSLALSALAPAARAASYTFAESPPRETLSETVPTAMAPLRGDASDFEIEWVSPAPRGVEARLVPGSLEWVRISDLVIVPRARIVVEADGAAAGQVVHAGFTQSLAPASGSGSRRVAEIPVALITGRAASVKVRVLRDEGEREGELQFRLKARPEPAQARVAFDSSCSPYGLSVDPEGLRLGSGETLYFGCRLVYLAGDPQRTSSLEVFVFWNGAEPRLFMDGMEAATPSPPFWSIRVAPYPGTTRLQAGSSEVRLKYRLPPTQRFGFLGAGLGPYLYRVDGPGTDVDAVAPILTLYGSYFITETTRIVAFDATAIHRDFYSDFGLYLNYESIRTLDRRLSVNLMLGAHFLWFRAGTRGNQVRMGGPQGVEAIFRDFLLPRHNLGVGAFILPSINDKSYYNAWVRWGTGALFGEVNYIRWTEPQGSDRVSSGSIGLSVGMPLFRFL